MTETPVIASSYTFDPFAQHKFYHDVNQSLVHLAIARLDGAHPKEKPVRVVELASGTGAVTELILDELERLGRPGTVIGVEPSPEAIEIASARLEARGARFFQGEADSLAKVAPNADAIFFCNAIHLVPDKRAAARQIASALAPDGFFACNSAFYQGTYAPGSERFYHLWTRRAEYNTAENEVLYTIAVKYPGAVVARASFVAKSYSNSRETPRGQRAAKRSDLRWLICLKPQRRW